MLRVKKHWCVGLAEKEEELIAMCSGGNEPEQGRKGRVPGGEGPGDLHTLGASGFWRQQQA